MFAALGASSAGVALAEETCDAFSVGVASSMQRVRPNGDEYGPFPRRGVSAQGVSLRLARNEWESVQICVKQTGGDLHKVRVVVDGDLTREGEGVFASSNITCSVVGYVNVTNKPPYRYGFTTKSDNPAGYYRATAPHRGGWWPDPILDFLGEADVKKGVSQSFWVRVHCPHDQSSGTYRGALIVSAEGGEPRRIPFAVRVNDFTLGRCSALPLLITFKPAGSKRDAASAVSCWSRHRERWIDFLADYFIVPDDLYRVDYGECKIDFDTLERLKREGRLGLFNLGYWGYPQSTNETHLASMRKDIDSRIGKAYRAAKERGLLEHAYIFGCDEVNPDKFSLVKSTAEYLKARFPDVPISTTARDGGYGVGTPLAAVDWFAPFSTWYKRGVADKSRAAGHKVWWYVCCTPEGNLAPAGWYVDRQAIEGRMLMGAQAVRMRPDGFLYYQTASWAGNKCIESGPYTAWNPRSCLEYNGDGSWVCAGPGGIPLSTIRLENFRDGLEDYAYAKILERLLKDVENGKCNVKSDGGVWISRAKAALAVTREVMDTMTNYTGDPVVLYRWRDEMADLIEEAMAATFHRGNS